jgi:mono/diheme cytochrome c family protein
MRLLVGLLLGLVVCLGRATEPPHPLYPLHPPIEPPASAPASPTDPVARKGQVAFAAKCAACHAIGGARQLGPDLLGVTRRRDLVWLARWLKWPQQMMGDDAAAKALHDQWVIAMPDPALTDEQVSQILAYLSWADRHVLPRHKPQPPALTSMSISS